MIMMTTYFMKGRARRYGETHTPPPLMVRIILDEMSSTELSAALRDVLEKRGVLSEVQAKLRAEVYKALDDESAPKPELCKENFLINELIREYLVYNHYSYTNSLLLTETGQPKEPLDREFLARELNIKDDNPSSIPLLYRMLSFFMGSSELDSKATATANTSAHHQPSARNNRTSGVCSIEEPVYPSSA